MRLVLVHRVRVKYIIMERRSSGRVIRACLSFLAFVRQCLTPFLYFWMSEKREATVEKWL